MGGSTKCCTDDRGADRPGDPGLVGGGVARGVHRIRARVRGDRRAGRRDVDTAPLDAVLDRWWRVAAVRGNPLTEAELAMIDRVGPGASPVGGRARMGCRSGRRRRTGRGGSRFRTPTTTTAQLRSNSRSTNGSQNSRRIPIRPSPTTIPATTASQPPTAPLSGSSLCGRQTGQVRA